MLGQTKFDNNQILNLYFLLMKKYEEAKFAGDGKHNIIFFQINTLLEVYYDKVIKEKLHFIDKCKLEILFKDVISTDLEHFLNIDEKEIEESCNDENLVSIIKDVSRKSPDQENFLNCHELYEHLENNSIIEIVNGNKYNEKQKKKPNQNYFPLDKFITKVNEGYPKSVENVNNIENFSKENPPNTDFENNNTTQVKTEERKPKQTKWKKPLPRFKYPFFSDNEKAPSPENYYIFSPPTKLLPEIQLKNIIETLQNVFINDKQDLSLNSKEPEQIEIIPSDNFNHTSLINNETDLNVPRQLTQSRNQNFTQIRTIDNIISSNSNPKFLSSINSLNLQVATAMNKYSDIMLDFPSNIVNELENPLTLDSSTQNLAISMQNLNASTEVPLFGTNNEVCQNEIMNLNTETNLPNAFQTITTQSFYNIRTPNLKPPQTYQNWLDYFQNNTRPIYYESPEKNKRKRRKRKQNNDINENGNGNNDIWNQIEPNRKQIDTYIELDNQAKDQQNTLFQRQNSEKRFDNEIVEYPQLRFKTQFQNFEKIFLESSPLKFWKLTKFEKYFFYSIQPSQVFGVFKDCSDKAKAVVLNKTAENNNSKIRRLSDNEILEVFNEIDMDISNIGLDVRTHLRNLKQKSQFFDSIFKNLDVYKIQN